MQKETTEGSVHVTLNVDPKTMQVSFEDLEIPESEWMLMTDSDQVERLSEYIDNLEQQPIIVVQTYGWEKSETP